MEFKDKKQKEFIQPQPAPKPANTGKISVGTNQNLTDEIKALVKHETTKVYNSLQKELSSEALKIAEDLALGLTDSEVMSKWQLDEDSLETYRSNPLFVSEYNRIQFNAGFANEQMRIRGMNRILSDMFGEIVSRPQFMASMPAEKLLDLFMKANAQMDKQIKGDVKPVYLDSVQIINNYIRDERRIKENTKGELVIESEYPVLDEVIEVEKNDEGIYE